MRKTPDKTAQPADQKDSDGSAKRNEAKCPGSATPITTTRTHLGSVADDTRSHDARFSMHVDPAMHSATLPSSPEIFDEASFTQESESSTRIPGHRVHGSVNMITIPILLNTFVVSSLRPKFQQKNICESWAFEFIKFLTQKSNFRTFASASAVGQNSNSKQIAHLPSTWFSLASRGTVHLRVRGIRELTHPSTGLEFVAVMPLETMLFTRHTVSCFAHFRQTDDRGQWWI